MEQAYKSHTSSLQYSKERSSSYFVVLIIIIIIIVVVVVVVVVVVAVLLLFVFTLFKFNVWNPKSKFVLGSSR